MNRVPPIFNPQIGLRQRRFGRRWLIAIAALSAALGGGPAAVAQSGSYYQYCRVFDNAGNREIFSEIFYAPCSPTPSYAGSVRMKCDDGSSYGMAFTNWTRANLDAKPYRAAALCYPFGTEREAMAARDVDRVSASADPDAEVIQTDWRP